MIRRMSVATWYVGTRKGNGLFLGRLRMSFFAALVTRHEWRWYVAVGLPLSFGWSVAPPFKHFALGLIAFGRGHEGKI